MTSSPTDKPTGVEPGDPRVRAASSISTGFRALLRPPFRTLWVLSLLIALASGTIRGVDDVALLGALLFAVVSLYIDIAAILAAGDSSPDRSADVWLKAAVRRRCFWRFFFASLISDVLIGLGLVGLVIGAFLLAGVIALAPPAAVLERVLPLQTLTRSAELTRGHRRPVATVYTILLLIPQIAIQGLFFLRGTESATVRVALGCVGATLGLAGTIALTRIFVTLGGGQTPELSEIEPGAEETLPPE